MGATIHAGTLVIGSAYPDPPFELIDNAKRTGFDVELMRAIASELGLSLDTRRYAGADFNGIFAGLTSGSYDAVISGTTITAKRSETVLFSQPYLTNIRSITDLRGLTAGIQTGNTSEAVARQLLADDAIAGITYYPYDAIGTALDDLETGRIGLVIKLYPVMRELVKCRPKLDVVIKVPTHEQIGIAFAQSNRRLCTAVNGSLQALSARGVLGELKERWFPATAHE